MRIDIPILLSALSLLVAFFVAASNYKRASKKDTQGDAAQLTTVIVKLETIGSDIKEIKNDLRDVQAEIRDHSERLVRAEQQLKVLNNAVFHEKEKDEK